MIDIVIVLVGFAVLYGFLWHNQPAQKRDPVDFD
jgi:hypothetical protein